LDFLPQLPDVFLGAEVELDIGDTQIAVEADISLDDDYEDGKKRTAREEFEEWTTPRILRIPFGMNVTGAVGGNASLICDLPSVGRKLEIKRIYLNLAAPVSQSLPTGLDIYLVAQPAGFNVGGPNPTDPLNLSAASILWSWKGSVLPIQQTWGRNEVVVYSPENVYLVAWTGGAVAAFTMAGNLQVVDTPLNLVNDKLASAR
jgi:hypothetical protein